MSKETDVENPSNNLTVQKGVDVNEDANVNVNVREISTLHWCIKFQCMVWLLGTVYLHLCFP